MEERQYFILRDKDKNGPYSLETLKEIEIYSNTKVWYAGLSKWTKASELPELNGVLSFPPVKSSNKKLILFLSICAFVIAGGFTSYRLLSASKPKSLAFEHPVNLSNQQLYKKYAPSVVLIEQRYMYEITAGERKFYFNNYYGYEDDMGYLMGLTEDSAKAADEAQSLQGTGFFINKDGMILTNRHVPVPPPSEIEQYQIQKYLFQSLNGVLVSANFIDSIKGKNLENDSLLKVLLQDSVTNSEQIATVKQKISDGEEIVADVDDSEERSALKIDLASMDYLKNQTINIRKITLELRVFLPGTKDLSERNGINCKVIATSEEENVDLALMQTANGELPDSTLKIVDFSRIKNSGNENLLPQMSERLILIGYNKGTDLAKTTEGIEAQLKDEGESKYRCFSIDVYNSNSPWFKRFTSVG